MSCARRWHRFGPHLQLPALRGDISNVLLVGWIACCDRAHNCDLISAVFCFTQFVSVSRFHLDQTRSDEIKHCAPKEALWDRTQVKELPSSHAPLFTECHGRDKHGRCWSLLRERIPCFCFFFNNFNIILIRLKFLHIPEWVSCGVPFWSPLPGTSSPQLMSMMSGMNNEPVVRAT